jgi:hypothetical protein
MTGPVCILTINMNQMEVEYPSHAEPRSAVKYGPKVMVRPPFDHPLKRVCGLIGTAFGLESCWLWFGKSKNIGVAPLSFRVGSRPRHWRHQQ